MVGPKTIRFQLLAAVNSALALLLVVFLILDYRREISDRVAQKHVALKEEAQTLLPGVLRLRPSGVVKVQQYVDDVCGSMRDVSSPGHHIAVRLSDGTELQARAHGRSSAEMFQAMQAAARSPTHRARFGKEELVVGWAQMGSFTVYVSEQLTNVRRSVRRQIIPRLVGIVLMAVVAAALVNLVLLRMVARPVRQLIDTVHEITGGRLGAQTGPLGSQEFDYLAEAINSMSSSLAETDHRRRQQMDKARRIQEHLLPEAVNVPGLTMAHLYQPAADVAGDYYDVIALPDGTWLLCVADVTGHGVPAAMSATMLKTLVSNAAEHQADLDQILRLTNRRFAAVCLPEDFASMALVRWSPEASTLEYASAGHEPGWFLPAAGSLRKLPSTGWLLAIREDATWETETLRVGPGDRLLLVTDGVTEAMSPTEEMFGRDRLARVFLRHRDISVAKTVQEIDRALTAHRDTEVPSDDATVVAIEFLAWAT